MSDFVIQYPGVFNKRDREQVQEYLDKNRAILDRGTVDVNALVKGKLPADTPGLGPSFLATEAMVRYNNQKYDSENTLLNDTSYARKLGYRDTPAYPTFAAHDDTFLAPFPPGTRDTLLISDLSHSVTNYFPVYPGDKLYMVTNARQILDLTPEGGSIYRSIALHCEGSIYNQDGQKVSDITVRATENLKKYKEGKGPQNPTFKDVWEAPDWKRRLPHYYTDDDWKLIRDIWSGEKRQGSEPLYWEDVKIGDEPGWTADGPIEETILPMAPYGMGIGGSRTLKKEILEPRIFKSMVRGKEDGIYRLANRDDCIPPVPDISKEAITAIEEQIGIKTVDIHRPSENRAALINYFGRDIAIRHINNWMGDQGWLSNVRWGIMPPEAHAAHGKYVAINPEAERFLEKVPKMKGKYILTHGLTGDLGIVKSYVYDKQVRDGEFLVDLAWWVETIDGYIWENGGATVRLPSKRA
jgi:hypothetical protein